MRVGIGWDSHRLEQGRELWLGGVRIPHQSGLLGISDADALLHAIIDAMLGAAALGDIGSHFPENDPAYAGIASIELLRRAVDIIAQAGYHVAQVDSIVIAEEPRLAAFIPEMRNRIREVLGAEAVSVKAKTAEGLDSVGRREAIQAQAVVLLEDSR